ncbi:hypothetical protein P3S68_017617 [Capsicum galapagoense]
MAFALVSSPSLVSVCDKTFIKPSSLTPLTRRHHKLSFIDQLHSNIQYNDTIVDCNDTGAEFLTVRIKCPMSEILDHPHAESVVFPKDLPWANNYEGGNLLVAQVSKFDCGGTAISMTTLVRSPRFVGDSIFSPENYGPLIAPQLLSDVSKCVQKRFIFPTVKIDALRAKVAAESGVENPTRAEVVSALLFNVQHRHHHHHHQCSHQSWFTS